MYMYILWAGYYSHSSGRNLVAEEGANGDAPGRNAGAFIQALLDLRDTYNQFLQESFAGDQLFKNAIASVRESLVHIITCTLVHCSKYHVKLW